ncbi:hypothetical protein M0R88_09305 [Halorussus gelatinilyticus]|uniref:Uncharacterized protein n=1 Tax=Halorussus gelatinilyticus TaxID=2937524 RepID=A0A8U0IQG4_9EURY|nr:hypothetical protein [Halorussus gelatinilyticus]UPW02269.1 hypothetical protein M0R88_09305 [Halorussus gelatinilyticus]
MPSDGRASQLDADPSDKGATADSSARDASRRGSYALAGLLVAVFLLGLLRLVSPTAAALAVGSLLALFGVAVGLLAVREKVR